MLKKTLFFFLFLNSSFAFSSESFLVDINWLQKNLKETTHLPYAAINTRNKSDVSFSVGENKIIKILGLLGIKPNHHIVIYDDMGGLHASRFFWELEKLGHKNISLLDGGLVKWILAGNKVTATSKYKTHSI